MQASAGEYAVMLIHTDTIDTGPHMTPKGMTDII